MPAAGAKGAGRGRADLTRRRAARSEESPYLAAGTFVGPATDYGWPTLV
jgi:hypothetical protein